MRGIRGWIRNLADGNGPAPGSVAVSAKPQVDATELDLATHGLGRLTRIHESGGSGSPVLADNIGHFGWDTELSPGPINVRVTPSDPQTEFRFRYPDESAQVGKAYHTDLERLGWAGGKSGLIWNAIPNSVGSHPAQWTGNPYETWTEGDGSVGATGTGASAGRWSVRPFIGMLGGVPFTVEMGDLQIPLAGDPPAPPNPAGQERFDVYCACMHDEPGSPLHGKQYFELIQGYPGQGIPPLPNTFFPVRRMPLHALRMQANSDIYSVGCVDLRSWINPPGGVIPHSLIRHWGSSGLMAGFGENIPAISPIANDYHDVHLPMNPAFEGVITYEAQIEFLPRPTGGGPNPNPYTYGGVAGITCEARGVSNLGVDVTPTYTPVPALLINVGGNPAGTNRESIESTQAHITWQIPRIPAYYVDTVLVQDSRTWTTFRVGFTITQRVFETFEIIAQRATLHLWPVP